MALIASTLNNDAVSTESLVQQRLAVRTTLMTRQIELLMHPHSSLLNIRIGIIKRAEDRQRHSSLSLANCLKIMSPLTSTGSTVPISKYVTIEDTITWYNNISTDFFGCAATVDYCVQQHIIVCSSW